MVGSTRDVMSMASGNWASAVLTFGKKGLANWPAVMSAITRTHATIYLRRLHTMFSVSTKMVDGTPLMAQGQS